jgi:predicted transcriptional regulator
MSSNSPSAKDRLRQLIDEQPDDSSHEEILRELAFACMVERGLADSRAGRTISHEEMKKTIESWRK